ncbi:MAG: hypothetical protein GSR84_07395 [Desulfurococcales archaeon]|nr:hypothetical protein [Desulfurococcales archaeon]
MARFYSDKELRGSTVYDKLGLAYGTLRGVRVEGGSLLLEIVVRASGRVVDVGMLRRRLGIEGPVEELVAEARRRGVGIPYRRMEGEVEMLKGLVPVEEVWVADYSEELGMGVVLLSTPREARYRGLPEDPPRPRLAPLEEVRGKPVVSVERGLLGLAEGYVIGPGEPGLRAVRSPGEEGYVSWLKFMNVLKKTDRGLYERLAGVYDPLRHTTLPLGELERVKPLLTREAWDLLEGFIVYRPRRGGFTDIPWSKVLALGDAVVVE